MKQYLYVQVLLKILLRFFDRVELYFNLSSISRCYSTLLQTREKLLEASLANFSNFVSIMRHRQFYLPFIELYIWFKRPFSPHDYQDGATSPAWQQAVFNSTVTFLGRGINAYEKVQLINLHRSISDDLGLVCK